MDQIEDPLDTFHLIDFVIDCCFIFDVLVSLNTGYYSKGSLVMQRIAIIKNYLKFWFWVDLVASTPYS